MAILNIWKKPRPRSLRKWHQPPCMKRTEYFAYRGSELIDTNLAYLRRTARKFLGPKSIHKTRFVPVESRSWMTELSIADQFINDVQLAKWGDQNRGIPPFNWKDVPILKDPFSLAVYPLLLWELKPATVIELGAYLGGSALWMADMMDTMNIKSHVYSYEIKRDLIKVEHPNITFIQMDLSKPENFDHEMLKSLPHPWLVIEDAHVNIYNTLSVFDKYVNAGDYVIVEDTLFPDTSKVEQFYAFLSEFGSGYEVDSHYTDMYGYNATWNLNGYLRKK